MTKTIDSLSPEDQQVLYDAIPNVTLLIANADGNIEPKELEWGEKITEIRSFSFDEVWQEYYETVSAQFSDRLAQLLDELPSDSAAMQQELSSRLAKLNGVLAHFDKQEAHDFTEGLRSFAHRIAKADGGVLGWFAVSPSEKELIDLPMIDQFEEE